MSKELINIISKDDLKTLVNQVYEQKRIYRNGVSVTMKFPLLRNVYETCFLKNSVDLSEIEEFVDPDYVTPDTIDDFMLNMYVEIEFFDKSIDINIYCFCVNYEINFSELNIQRTPESTVEETTDAIIELIEKINNKQDLFKLVWSE